MAGQKIGDHDGEQRKSQHGPYPQASRHAGQFRIGRVTVTVRGSSAMPQMGQGRARRARFADAWGRCIRCVPWGGGLGWLKRHAAFRASSRLSGEHFRMHGAGVLGSADVSWSGPMDTRPAASRHIWPDQPRTLSGILRNRSTRCVPRARPMLRPSCGNTFMPHTGSISAKSTLPCSHLST